MALDIAREVAALGRMTVRELRRRYAEAFGEETRANNKAWLVKRVAWRLQAVAEGGLSERAKRRAAELANEADLRLSPPKPRPAEEAPERTVTVSSPATAESRLPPPGTLIRREYKGRTLLVRVLENGFEHDGAVHRSLSAVAKAVTGSHCNGYLFFRLGKHAEDA